MYRVADSRTKGDGCENGQQGDLDVHRGEAASRLQSFRSTLMHCNGAPTTTNWSTRTGLTFTDNSEGQCSARCKHYTEGGNG